MKKTLYDFLQVSKSAEPEVIEGAYQRLCQKYESDFSEDSKNQIIYIRHAYEILSKPDERALYDQKLSIEDATQGKAKLQSSIDASDYQSNAANVFTEWWRTPKVTGIIMAVTVLIGFSLYNNRTHENNKVEIVNKVESTKQQANDLNARNMSKHMDNEGTLVEGVIENNRKYIDASANVANRMVDVARQEEDRRRTELEYRANAGTQLLEMQRKEQEARLEMQKKKQADYAQMRTDQEARRQMDYYTCLNAAIDKYGAERGQVMCRR